MAHIGKYEIEKELGKGASSTVYLAHDTLSGGKVAIKLLNLEGVPEGDAAQFRKHFLTEASLAGRLAHPYIVAIHDAVISDEASYLVMEYVAGGTLDRHCRVDNLLPHDKVVEIMFKCCHALSHAHQNGIIHRDIKPKNILLVGDTDIRISDFGAAMLKDDSTAETAAANIGSLPYMSPQQAQGMELNQQTDIYSLGVVFYRMLTGSLPFAAGDDAGMMFQILHVDPPPPSHYRPGISARIDAIVMRAIARNLEDRYCDWSEFGHDLVEAALESLPQDAAVFRDTDKFNTLLGLDFFRSFGELELWEALRLAKWAYYPEGTVIIREGDETASFFIIISGEAEVRKSGRTLCNINAGASFGEMAALRQESRRRSASVHACSDIRLIEIGEESLRQASKSCQHCFDRAFLAILSDRLAASTHAPRERQPIRYQPDLDGTELASVALEAVEVRKPLFVIEVAGFRFGAVALAFLLAYLALIHILLVIRL